VGDRALAGPDEDPEPEGVDQLHLRQVDQDPRAAAELHLLQDLAQVRARPRRRRHHGRSPRSSRGARGDGRASVPRAVLPPGGARRRTLPPGSVPSGATTGGAASDPRDALELLGATAASERGTVRATGWRAPVRTATSGRWGRSRRAAHPRGAAAGPAGDVVDLPEDLPAALVARLERAGVTSLWSHQREARDRVRAGRHTVVATGTASGQVALLPAPDRRAPARGRPLGGALPRPDQGAGPRPAAGDPRLEPAADPRRGRRRRHPGPERDAIRAPPTGC
jgi:hypothetical protein